MTSDSTHGDGEESQAGKADSLKMWLGYLTFCPSVVERKIRHDAVLANFIKNQHQRKLTECLSM